ncbi:MAG: hypothetical protein LBS43_03315 [Prevotellaceae bacterium]|jgi:hypothetical protein|nr:hypothetical protein [Prevotellaceae bacterium]
MKQYFKFTKKGIHIWIILCVTALYSCYSGKKEEEVRNADWLLAQYGKCDSIKPEENRIGFAVKSLSADSLQNITVSWQSSMEEIMKNPRNHAVIVSRLHFIDPCDSTNCKSGFESSFREDLGYLDSLSVKLDRPTGLLVIYFEGIEATMGEEYATPPLFFMAALGEKTELLEPFPRHAGEIFKYRAETVSKQSVSIEKNYPVTSITFSGGSCRLDGINLTPMFAPANMAAGNRAFSVGFKYTLESGQKDNVLSILYDKGRFVAPDGKSYKAGAASSYDDVYSLHVDVPKSVDVKSLKFVLGKQVLSLK